MLHAFGRNKVVNISKKQQQKQKNTYFRALAITQTKNTHNILSVFKRDET